MQRKALRFEFIECVHSQEHVVIIVLGGGSIILGGSSLKGSSEESQASSYSTRDARAAAKMREMVMTSRHNGAHVAHKCLPQCRDQSSSRHRRQYPGRLCEVRCVRPWEQHSLLVAQLTSHHLRHFHYRCARTAARRARSTA